MTTRWPHHYAVHDLLHGDYSLLLRQASLEGFAFCATLLVRGMQLRQIGGHVLLQTVLVFALLRDCHPIPRCYRNGKQSGRS